MSIDIRFKEHPCRICENTMHVAVLKGKRYGLYCKYCGSFIKWANSKERVIIEARASYLYKEKIANRL